MRAECPVAYVPQLDATVLTRRDDIFEDEKKIEISSSDQPDGLMTKLMGQNMMRKDGAVHMAERKAIFPTISPKTVKTIWRIKFEDLTAAVLDDIAPKGEADTVCDITMRISGEALKVNTGLTQVSWQEMDRVSQGMMDGCANYIGDPEVKARCNDCTAAIDRYIDEIIPELTENPDTSLLSVHLQTGLSEEQYRANVKLAISGGQNEPRDVISGLTWALLTHPDQLQMVLDCTASWLQAFEEYAR